MRNFTLVAILVLSFTFVATTATAQCSFVPQLGHKEMVSIGTPFLSSPFLGVVSDFELEKIGAFHPKRVEVMEFSGERTYIHVVADDPTQVAVSIWGPSSLWDTPIHEARARIEGKHLEVFLGEWDELPKTVFLSCEGHLTVKADVGGGGEVFFSVDNFETRLTAVIPPGTTKEGIEAIGFLMLFVGIIGDKDTGSRMTTKVMGVEYVAVMRQVRPEHRKKFVKAEAEYALR